MSKLTRCSVFTSLEIGVTVLNIYKEHADYLNRKCDSYVSIKVI